MTAEIDQNEILVEDAETAREIVETIANIKPETSLSFTLSSEGLRAVMASLQLIDWGIGKNKPKLKAAALEVITPLADAEPGLPNNVNLTEFELKAMEEVLAVLERALSKEKDGVITL